MKPFVTDSFDSWLSCLPDGWSLKKVAREFRFIGSGTTPPTDNQDWYGGDTPWVTTGELRENLITETGKTVADSALENFSALKIYPEGTLLVAMYGATIGRLGLLGKSATTNQACCALVGPIGLESKYVFYWLQAFRDQLIRKASGGGQPNINQDTIRALRVSAPDIPVQKSAVAFLDEQTTHVDALITEKETLLQKLHENQYSYASRLMTQGLTVLPAQRETSFPELGSTPSHWTVKRLKFLGEVRSGIAKGKDHGEKDTVSLPYLRVANVQDGYLDLTEVLEIEVGAQEVERFLLKKGDVLMNEGGDNDKLGRGTVWEGQIDPCVHQNHVFAVRMFDTSLAEWVARFTSTDAARTYFFLRSKQSTNLASINQTNVRELPVPMPPEEEREAILAEIRRSAKATSDLVEHVKEHIERLKEYRASLISAAVTGQLDLSQFKVAA